MRDWGYLLVRIQFLINHTNIFLCRSRFAQGPRPYTPDNHPGSVLTISEGYDNWVGPELDKGYSAVRWNSPLDENGEPVPLPLVSHNNPENFSQTGITSTNSIAIEIDSASRSA